MLKKFSEKNLWKGSQVGRPPPRGGTPYFSFEAVLVHLRGFKAQSQGN